jgi:hypothetical protein
LPAAFDWSQKDGADLTYGMFGNDLYGDCVFASACHQILTWSGQTDVEEAIAEADALDAYRRFTGFDPVTGANDEGAVMLDVAKRWAKGEKIAGHVLKAFVAVDQTRLDLVDAVCNLFGGIWTGWDIPAVWMNGACDVWDAPKEGEDSRCVGGHAMHVPAISPAMYSSITWGGRKPITPLGWRLQCREAYAPISVGMWAKLKEACPAGLDLQKLIDLMAVVRS